MVLKVLDFIDYLAKQLCLVKDNDNIYRNYIDQIRELGTNDVHLSSDVHDNICAFLNYIQLKDVKSILKEYNVSSFDEIQDGKLLILLNDVLRTVVFKQNKNLLLLKYSKIIWNIGWSKWSELCRGKVIDLNTRKIVVYPFDKFYNFNEVPSTQESVIIPKLERAKEIYVTDKKDGSAIIITNYNGKLIINTNGEFDNTQITLAKELLNKKYSYFYKNVPEGYTFIFELIHPDNAIVIDYGDTKKLYLIAVRNLSDNKLKSYPELLSIAEKYKLDITESFEYTDFYDFLNIALNATTIKEGWVFRVVTDDEDFMFKLKYQEYFKLARIKSIPTVKKVYTLMIDDRLDDLLSVSDDVLKKSILDVVKDIEHTFDFAKDKVRTQGENILKEYGYERGKVPSNVLPEIVNKLKGNLYMTYILRYIKSTKSLDDMFNVLPFPTMFSEIYKNVCEEEKRTFSW